MLVEIAIFPFQLPFRYVVKIIAKAHVQTVNYENAVRKVAAICHGPNVLIMEHVYEWYCMIQFKRILNLHIQTHLKTYFEQEIRLAVEFIFYRTSSHNTPFRD